MSAVLTINYQYHNEALDEGVWVWVDIKTAHTNVEV